MKEQVVAVTLKIPDNAAYSALMALRRLGVHAARIERSVLHRIRETKSASAITADVEADESIFNPNKHRLTVLASASPRDGEVWIVEDGTTSTIAWRLFDENGAPVAREVLEQAAERLLCNPAVERALFPEK